MASAAECFDVEKVQNEIFQPKNRHILMIMKFVAETARILREKRRLQQFVFLADRSIALLQGNLKLKKIMLLEITIGYPFDIEQLECAEVLQYYILVEKMFHDSVDEQKLRINILLQIGKAYILTAHYGKALEYTLKAEKIAIEVKVKPLQALCCTNQGITYSHLGEYERAIMYYQRGLNISSEIGGRLEMANHNAHLGNACISLGEYKRAIMYYKKGLEISAAIGDQSGIAGNNGNLGNAYRNLGEYEKAIMYYEKGIEISSAIGDRSRIASHNGNLGNAYLSLGEYEKAIVYYQIGLEISSAIGDRLTIASNSGNLGNVYFSLGEYEKAIMYYQKGLDISSAIGDRSRIAGSNGSLGNAYLILGEYEKAITYYKKGLEISRVIDDQSRIACNNGHLGNVHLILGEYEIAIIYYQEGLDISSAIGDRSGIANNYANLGNAYRNLGDYEKAIEFLMKGLKVSVEFCEPNIESSCLGFIGVTYFLEAQSKCDKPEAFTLFQQAVSYLMRSVHCSDQIFSTLVVDQNKISFAKKYFNRYVTLMRCFIFLKRIEAALLVIDLGKAKALYAFRQKLKKSKTEGSMDLIWKMIDNKEEKMRTKEIQEALELKSNSSVLLYAFDDDEFLNIFILNGEDGVKTFKYNKLLKQFDSFFNFLLSNFEVNLNRDSSFHKLDSAGLTPFFQMVVTDQLDRKAVENKSVDATKQAKTSDLDKHKTTSTARVLNQQSDEIESSNNISAAVDLLTENVFQLLYRVLIQPVKEFIKGTKVIIVPDKFLFFVPFCSLLDENGCRLSENYSIQITPSLHTLVSNMTRSRDPSLGFALFVGNPTIGKVSFRGKEIEPSFLPSASKEVQYLARLFEAQPLVNGEATKERVLKCIHGASIIHIAAHGEPDRGEILLAPNPNMTEQSSSLPTEENDYLLKQRDIMKITINAHLVVLCCCHTGKGKISSEGVVGLARAFLCAGARSVLATLWPIHDEGTRGFMNIFYKEICNETSVCEALRKTMNTFQEHENEEFRSFKIWAPFTIYGEDVSFTRDNIEEIKQKSREMNF